MLSRQGSKAGPTWLRSSGTGSIRGSVAWTAYFLILLTGMPFATRWYEPFPGIPFDAGPKVAGFSLVSYGPNARGFLAVGERAIGVVAYGRTAVGVFAVGPLAIGVASFGFLGLGVFTFAFAGLGRLALCVFAAGYHAFGFVAFGTYAYSSKWLAIGFREADGPGERLVG